MRNKFVLGDVFGIELISSHKEEKLSSSGSEGVGLLFFDLVTSFYNHAFEHLSVHLLRAVPFDRETQKMKCLGDSFTDEVMDVCNSDNIEHRTHPCHSEPTITSIEQNRLCRQFP